MTKYIVKQSLGVPKHNEVYRIIEELEYYYYAEAIWVIHLFHCERLQYTFFDIISKDDCTIIKIYQI